MSGILIDGDPAVTILEKQRLGYNGTTLTNFTNTSAPQIVGNFELAGSIASFASLESITGWAALATGTVYIKCLATGTTVTAEFTSTAPTWDNLKMGWYGTGANATHRYLFQLQKGSSALYEDKKFIATPGIQGTEPDDEVIFISATTAIVNKIDVTVVSTSTEQALAALLLTAFNAHNLPMNVEFMATGYVFAGSVTGIPYYNIATIIHRTGTPNYFYIKYGASSALTVRAGNATVLNHGVRIIL